MFDHGGRTLGLTPQWIPAHHLHSNHRDGYRRDRVGERTSPAPQPAEIVRLPDAQHQK